MAALPLPFDLVNWRVARRVVLSGVFIAAVVAVATPIEEPPPRLPEHVALAETIPFLTAPPVVDVVEVVEDRSEAAVASWSKVKPSGGCWFFSGPDGLGRDHDLGSEARMLREGAALTVRFGTATFQGDVDARGRVVLQHKGDGADGGDGWLYNETLTGKLSGNTLVAQYAYRECELDGRGGCPVVSRGNCTISGAVTINAAPRVSERAPEPEPQPCVEYD
ncbi:MAG: hypothetical protein Q8O67_09485 [Deltaproteobacteria bacterium]|nr:hypothetical protein [Deltaproteobacteria bacterium]